MCGIFGVCYTPQAQVSAKETRKMLDHLFCYSQSRGKEASGLLFKHGNELELYKDTIRGNHFIKTARYKSLFEKLTPNNSTMIIGHARLDTNGSKWDNTNNSPIIHDNIQGIHNGIVTNVDQLWQDNPELERHYVVDSEVLLALFSKHIKQHTEEQALASIFELMEGSASVALYDTETQKLTLATNTGSLYFSRYDNDFLVFASEQYILEQLHKKMRFLRRYSNNNMRQITPKTAVVIDTQTAQNNPYEGRMVHALL